MNHLSEADFEATFGDPMTPVPEDAEPPFDFWEYFDEIPEEHFGGHDCSDGGVTHVYRDPTGRYEHVLVNSDQENAFMVVVLNLPDGEVLGHRLLSLNEEYGVQVADDAEAAEPTNE